MRRGMLVGLLIAWVAVILLFRTALAAQLPPPQAASPPAISEEYGFRAFWDAHNGALMLGPALTDVVFEANVPVQYFERGRLEQRDGAVTPGAVGREHARWRALPPLGGTPDTTAALFRHFWDEHEGALLLGPALGAPIWQAVDGGSIRVQYFERGRLEAQPKLDQVEVVVGALGREIALAKGLITAREGPARALTPLDPDAPDAAFGSLLPTPTPLPTPEPTPVPAGPPVPAAPIAVGQVIAVDLSTQALVAYSDGVPVYQAYVATGKDGFDTPTGTYQIVSKLRSQTMRGSMNGETWVVPDVPYVMYFNGSVALHGTYWHNLFGTGYRLSHGCVNLSPGDAAWLYSWAPIGTTVVVHY